MFAANAGYMWVKVDLREHRRLDVSTLPSTPVIGGTERSQATFIARVKHEGQFKVAKLNHWARYGFVSNGKEMEVDVGEILIPKNHREPVWISSAYGEHLREAVSVDDERSDRQIGRAWHKNTWVPGEVDRERGCLSFPYGGKEVTSRHYQVLLGTVSWQAVPVANSERSGFVVPLYDADVPSRQNSIRPIEESWQSDRPSSQAICPETFGLLEKDINDCYWRVSGDGEDVRHAIMVDHYFIGRVRSEGQQQGNQNVQGFVRPLRKGQQATALVANNKSYETYEVLMASVNQPCTMTFQLSADSIGSDYASPSLEHPRLSGLGSK